MAMSWANAASAVSEKGYFVLSLVLFGGHALVRTCSGLVEAASFTTAISVRFPGW